jgi:hypothetical protein
MSVEKEKINGSLPLTLIVTFLCLLAQLATSAHSQVYKCKLPNGSTVIQDTECAKSEDYSTGQGVAIQPKASKHEPPEVGKAQKTIQEQMEERASAEAANKVHEAARPKSADEAYTSPYAAKEKTPKSCVGCENESDITLSNVPKGYLWTAVILTFSIYAFVGFIARRLNRSFLLWFVLAFFFSPLVIIILLIVGRKQ